MIGMVQTALKQMLSVVMTLDTSSLLAHLKSSKTPRSKQKTKNEKEIESEMSGF
jgi:hypothetical protein